MKPHGNPGVWRKGLRATRNLRPSRPSHNEAATLEGIEQRWLERAAEAEAADREYQSGERGGLDPDLELAILTTPNVQVILLPEPDAEA